MALRIGASGIDTDGLAGRGANDPASVLFGYRDNEGIADFAVVPLDISNVTVDDRKPGAQPADRLTPARRRPRR